MYTIYYTRLDSKIDAHDKIIDLLDNVVDWLDNIDDRLDNIIDHMYNNIDHLYINSGDGFRDLNWEVHTLWNSFQNCQNWANKRSSGALFSKLSGALAPLRCT